MKIEPAGVLGWDIGGVNLKAVWTQGAGERGETRQLSVPYEIWKEPGTLPGRLRSLASELGPVRAMALTMTAELSDAFESKRRGVEFILKAMKQAFPETPIMVLDLDGRWAELEEARERPLDFAANNWMAGALYAGLTHPDCVWVDMGSTTTDIIPIVGGRPVAKGRDDTARLAVGELVYTGLLRSNPRTLVRRVPFNGVMNPVADEFFTIMADARIVLGSLDPDSYDCSTPDGRGVSPRECHARLARLVCGDIESVSLEQVRLIAAFLCEEQMARLTRAWHLVASRLPVVSGFPLVAAGVGLAVIEEMGRRLGLPVLDLGECRALPALAAACLLAGELEGRW